MTKTEEIRERWAKVTKGPWVWLDGQDSLGILRREGEPMESGLYGAGQEPVVFGVWRNDGYADCEADEADGQAIAAAPTDIDHLLAERDRYREALEFYSNPESVVPSARWEDNYPGGITYNDESDRTFIDTGEVARTALEELPD